ncbi:MAG: tryptophan 2,3-dioxygenase family protein [Chitinophagales bacterium]|nr:tryptophan 2,3-dioxygenase [Bacteroidota bacterium]
MENNDNYQGVYYSEYLDLDKLLSAQHPESAKMGQTAHDEMLFIVIHQAYELWFKQVLYELESIKKIFVGKLIDDHATDLQIAIHRLRRIVKILELLVQQMAIMETMTPLDFLDFRDLLRPASGFQSIQFKIIEAVLGLKMKHRHGYNYYLSQLKPKDKERIEAVEKQASVIEGVNGWLERMPFFDVPYFWKNYQNIYPQDSDNSIAHPFWRDYRQCYAQSLVSGEKKNLELFDAVFLYENEDITPHLSAAACRAALFIMLYRDFPLLHQPFQLLNSLLDIDEALADWRSKHINMVQRMIGARVGTGGSTGSAYLKGALDAHYIFKEFSQLTTFLIERKHLPKLSKELTDELSFFPQKKDILD